MSGPGDRNTQRPYNPPAHERPHVPPGHISEDRRPRA